MPQIIDFSALFVKLDDIISEAVFSLTETIKGKDATGLSDMREQILGSSTPSYLHSLYHTDESSKRQDYVADDTSLRQVS